MQVSTCQRRSRRGAARTLATAGPSGVAPTVRGVLSRACRVEAVIERPPAPPWVGELPVPEAAAWWPGRLRAWRWIDREKRVRTGLVTYCRDGLLYEHWVSGELIQVEPDDVDEEGTDLPTGTCVAGGGDMVLSTPPVLAQDARWQEPQ